MDSSKLSGHYFLNDDNLKSDIKEFKIKIDNYEFKFKTDNGVFSKGELDFGTELLIKTVLKEKIKGNILDLGCGYGAIGIVLNKILKVNVNMIDVNKRAIHLTKMNIKENDCSSVLAFLSDGYSNVDKKYDYIVSNPPIRIGKSNLYKLISDSKNYLNDCGKIYLVIRREQGAKTFIKDFSSEYKIDILEKKKGFYIICLKI
ncbi:MAG: class I SAM-dependent methyltransferase [Bacilli bacterium]|nr:class I SAM-dependent methyltransferase [Bacilli bacterium]